MRLGATIRMGLLWAGCFSIMALPAPEPTEPIPPGAYREILPEEPSAVSSRTSVSLSLFSAVGFLGLAGEVALTRHLSLGAELQHSALTFQVLGLSAQSAELQMTYAPAGVMESGWRFTGYASLRRLAVSPGGLIRLLGWVGVPLPEVLDGPPVQAWGAGALVAYRWFEGNFFFQLGAGGAYVSYPESWNETVEAVYRVSLDRFPPWLPALSAQLGWAL